MRELEFHSAKSFPSLSAITSSIHTTSLKSMANENPCSKFIFLKQVAASAVQDAALQTSPGSLVSAGVGLNIPGVSINGPTLDCGAIIGLGLAPS
jgi:hypothetical protein